MTFPITKAGGSSWLLGMFFFFLEEIDKSLSQLLFANELMSCRSGKIKNTRCHFVLVVFGGAA